MKHLISLKEQTGEDLLEILELAKRLKTEHQSGRLIESLHNKTLISVL